MAGLDTKSLITALDKKVKNIGIFWVERGDVINRLDEDKRIDVFCLAGMGRGIIFRADKNLRVDGGPMAKLSASTTLDKRARPDANYLLDKKRNPFFKPEKESKGAWGPNSKKNVLVAGLDKKKGSVVKLGTGRGYRITGLEIMAI